MTCASCAMRIEKRLNKLDGVAATVNYATEKAKVAVTGAITTDDLVAAVEAAGYTAHPPTHRLERTRSRDRKARTQPSNCGTASSWRPSSPRRSSPWR